MSHRHLYYKATFSYCSKLLNRIRFSFCREALNKKVALITKFSTAVNLAA